MLFAPAGAVIVPLNVKLYVLSKEGEFIVASNAPPDNIDDESCEDIATFMLEGGVEYVAKSFILNVPFTSKVCALPSLISNIPVNGLVGGLPPTTLFIS